MMLTAASLVICGASLAAADPKSPMVIVPTGTAKLTPVDPADPKGARQAVLQGDPNTGPSAILLEFKKGVPSELHVHTSDYHLVVLEGTMKHWNDQGSEATAKPLGPGSYWFQPGNQPHAGVCLSDRCLMFVAWPGKRDGRPVAPAKPK
jgi:quercetin dioxygenase-like cupin family protein